MNEALTAATAVMSTRGGIVENRHLAHVAVTGANGSLLYAFGAYDRQTLIRSTAKPAQALAVLRSSARVRDAVTDEEIALMCASHSAADVHLVRARAMLAKFDLCESQLVCGGHPSLSDAVNREWLLRGIEPGPLCSNCSGKHIGMAAAAADLTGSSLGYHLDDHPLQAEVRQVLAQSVGLPVEHIDWAIDGCNLPTPALPLDKLSLLYAKLAAAGRGSTVDHGVALSATPPEVAWWARIYRAMTRHPELVAGEGRFCTALMQAYAGALVAKVGAEGCYALGICGELVPHLASRSGGAIGIAVKVEDGSVPIVQRVVCEVLRQLHITLPTTLESFHTPTLYNTAGVAVGDVRCLLRLRDLSASAAQSA